MHTCKKCQMVQSNTHWILYIIMQIALFLIVYFHIMNFYFKSFNGWSDLIIISIGQLLISILIPFIFILKQPMRCIKCGSHTQTSKTIITKEQYQNYKQQLILLFKRLKTISLTCIILFIIALLITSILHIQYIKLTTLIPIFMPFIVTVGILYKLTKNNTENKN